MVEERTGDDMDFGQAFAQAAGLPRPTKEDAEVAPEPTRAGAQDAQAREDAAENRNAPERLASSAGPAEDAHDSPTDETAPDDAAGYRQLYERERQRLRSFQGRYRKEKERWLAERASLLEALTRADNVATSEGEPSPAGQDDQPVQAESSGHSKQVAQPGQVREPEASPAPIGSPLADNPELARAICAMVRATVEELGRPVLASLEAERHMRRIAAAHPDWERLAAGPELSEWIERQPDYLAASLRRVVESGSADEVIDLLTRFKQDQGLSTDTGQKALNQARREREAERAAAVPSRSAGPAKGRPDKGDFRAAWSEAASSR